MDELRENVLTCIRRFRVHWNDEKVADEIISLCRNYFEKEYFPRADKIAGVVTKAMKAVLEESQYMVIKNQTEREKLLADLEKGAVVGCDSRVDYQSLLKRALAALKD